MIKILSGVLAILSFFAPKSTVNAWASFNESDGVYDRVQIDERVIALTFDDGPHPYLTPEILEILDDFDAKATFFVVGSMARLYPATLKAVSDAGHEIGNHTYTHLMESNGGCEKLKKEIIDTEQAILEIALQKSTLFRPPTGYICKNAVKMTGELGYKTIVWDIDTKDWAHNSPQKILAEVKKYAKNGSIILFHDFIGTNSPTPAALRLVLPYLKEQGYRFVTVSEMLNLKYLDRTVQKQHSPLLFSTSLSAFLL